MSDVAIDIQNLSKVYRIDAASGKAGARTLQEDIKSMVKAPFNRKEAKAKKEEIWALKDVGFQVQWGEVIGIIGRNGAGKSTLLKILSRITEPSSGVADIYGRIGSLLEVGTGFHTELTGRENVYLSGAVLGMRKAEIDRKYEEIVEFSGIQHYIDTPVKRYSSGMAVRLAFAVAAHLDPEILLIDEVLAVGDVSFQQKCLGKMSEVAGSGRTILFVSHDMGAIKGLCDRAAWLDDGQLKALGDVDEVVNQYLVDSSVRGEWLTDISMRTDRTGDGRLRFTGFRLRGADGNYQVSPVAGEPVDFVLSFESSVNKIKNATIHIWIRDAFLKGMISFSTKWTGDVFSALPNKGEIVCHIPRFPLRAGRYFIDLGANIDGLKADRLLRAEVINVINGNFYGSGSVPSHPNDGDFLCDHEWSIA